MATDTVESSVGLRSERGAVLGALMLSTGLVALDSTIIATAILTITQNLGGFAQFPWLFSIYLLAQAATVPIYGKLADTFGRKPVLLFGIAVFAVGSLLCGLATSMLGLIVFRAIQGLGAGAVQPMTLTIAGDLYTLSERARVQGYLAAVWATSSVLGPLLGGLFSEYLSWRLIFLVNLPLSALAAWMIVRHFKEAAPRRRHGAIDYPGAVLLTLGAGAVILGLLEGGHSWAWTSPASLCVFGGGVLALAVFTAVERRASNPILPLWVFTRRVLVATSVISLLVGAVLLGLTSYVPTFAQGVLGSSALIAGLTVGALTLGWPITGTLAGKVYLRIGFRNSALIGSGIAIIGAASLLLAGVGSTVWQLAGSCFLIGLGMGLVSTPSIIAAQSSAPWHERGVVTSTTMFARSIGSAVGVAVFGAVVNSQLHGADRPAPAALADAVHLVFLGVTAAAVVMILAALMLPGRPGADAR
ncbi:MDR family MFS transporter [Nocardia sp. NPDC048505]|uniref:MDR family MFS transporter n=1 Tax=Nocardia sp. NPDC048505 TaxID=3155756 RepID=UPI0033F57D92